jgi:hypothetical protein
MKLQDATEVVVNENHFYVRPFPAFRAANISGEVIKVIIPIIGSVLPFVSTSGDTSVLDTDLATIAPEITKAFESLSGDAVEKLLRDLLVKGNNIAVDFNGETKPLTEDLVNELFCGEVQDMYILAFHVIRINYGGFFGKLGTQSGKVAELAQKLMK